ncbi:hypothetical protein ROZALSC1DRAFT_24867, partial [Rozella allomycis CSF55]
VSIGGEQVKGGPTGDKLALIAHNNPDSLDEPFVVSLGAQEAAERQGVAYAAMSESGSQCALKKMHEVGDPLCIRCSWLNSFVPMREISFLMPSKRALGLVLEILPVHVLSLLNVAHMMIIAGSGSSLHNSKVIPKGPSALLLGAFSIAMCISLMVISAIKETRDGCHIYGAYIAHASLGGLFVVLAGYDVSLCVGRFQLGDVVKMCWGSVWDYVLELVQLNVLWMERLIGSCIVKLIAKWSLLMLVAYIEQFVIAICAFLFLE